MSSSGQKCDKPTIAIIGGTGLETFPEIRRISSLRTKNKYGTPSDEVVIGECGGKLVAFLPRHGRKHNLPPHKIPYKANLQALKDLGVEYVIGTCVTGSLKKEIAPGSVVIPDQFVNFTWGRDDSYAADKGFIHLPMGEPYCSSVRNSLIEFADSVGETVRKNGTVVVIQGPRFSTAAESRWFSANGWDIVNMTQYPECYFAKELGMCYAAVASVTDYDAGLQETLTIDPRYAERFLKIFKENTLKTRGFLCSFMSSPFASMSCKCSSEVVKAYYE